MSLLYILSVPSRSAIKKLFSAYCPVYEQLSFSPSIFHRFWLQKHDCVRKSILFVGRSQTRTRSFCDARLKATKARKSQKSIRVLPSIQMFHLLHKLILLLTIRIASSIFYACTPPSPLTLLFVWTGSHARFLVGSFWRTFSPKSSVLCRRIFSRTIM